MSPEVTTELLWGSTLCTLQVSLRAQTFPEQPTEGVPAGLPSCFSLFPVCFCARAVQELRKVQDLTTIPRLQGMLFTP